MKAVGGRPAKEKLGCILLTDSPEEPTSWRCSTFVLRCRDRGFMALFPCADEVGPTLESFAVGPDEDGVVISEVEVAFETARRHQLGRGPALIADIPWGYLPLFRRFAYRGEGPLLTFRVDGALAKPTDDSATVVGQSWISEMLDEDTAHEYASAAEQAEEEDPELIGGGDVGLGVRGNPSEVTALRTRLAQLETLLASRDPPAAGLGQPTRLESMVFGGQQSAGLNPQEIEALKRAVGPPPGRIGRNEGQQRASVNPTVDKVQFAEEDREAGEADAEQELVSALQAQLPSNPDPFQKMLILQLKQTSDLVKALAPRASADPLQAVLGGSDSGSAGSSGGSGGVKGYAARELFLEQIEDDSLVVLAMRKHARQELGISEAKEEGSLMRTYLEQRIPIGDHRTMAQVGFMMAWGWEAAATTNNLQMQAFCGKMLSYVEQACLDGGEDLGHPQQSDSHNRQGDRESSCSSKVGQEEEGWKRRRRSHRRSIRCMTESNLPGSPEQRSKSHESDRGKIVEEEPCFRPRKSCVSNSTPSYLNNIQLDKALDAFSLIDECLRHLERIPCSFNTFKAKSLKPCWLSRTVEGSATPRQPLWPIPPPLWGRWKGCNSPNPRKRHRLKQLEVQNKLLQHVVCMLNWIILGYPDRPNRQAQAGEPVSAEQYKVLETLECHIAHFCRLPSFARTDLGRFGEKFDALFRASQELPASVEVDLDVLLHEISNSFDSYAKYEAPHFAARSTSSDVELPQKLSPGKIKLPNVSNKPVIASRIKWKNPPSFDPRPYLVDPVVAAVFDGPDVLRLPQNQWPTKRKARVHCSRPELLKLVKIWDAYGSLALVPCEDIPTDETVGIFAVPKDHQYDRLIINPTVINSRMAGYSHFTKKLAPGALISLLSLEPHQALRYNADDLSDFYYTFRVSSARAKRNAIGVPLYRSEVEDFSCVPKDSPGPFYPALATLAMGDNHAVEIAQCSHHSLLQIEAGCMNDCETLEYRKPVPRSDFIEMLAIDDHIGLQKVDIKDLPFKFPDRDTRVFEQSNRAYSKVGLVSHPGKQRRFETEGVLLGADLDGIAGRVSAPRSRILMLILVTSIVCRKGTCTRQMLSSILGCWIHVVLFRRPLLALIDALFKEGIHLGDNKTFRLSSQARHELMSLCILGTCAQADLRVSFCPRIYALDASPWGGGIVVSEATSAATSELWRHSEQRGYHTNLLGQAASCLKELGFDSAGELDQGFDDFRDCIPDQTQLRIPPPLREGFIYDCVELFRGSGNWSKAHESHGFSVHDSPVL